MSEVILNSSHELLKFQKIDSNVIDKVPNRELFNRYTLYKVPISTMMKGKKYVV